MSPCASGSRKILILRHYALKTTNCPNPAVKDKLGRITTPPKATYARQKETRPK